MAGQVVVRSNLVLNQVNIGDDVVLGAVQSTGLDCGVNIALSHGNTVSAAVHEAHHLDAGVRTHDADLHALAVIGSDNSLVAGVQVAGAQGVVGQNGEALSLGLGVQVSQLAGLENLLLVLDAVVHIGSAQDSEVGAVGLDDGVGNQSHVQGAHNDLLQSLSLVAQLSVGVNFDGVAAFGSLKQLLTDPLQGHCLGVCDGLVECALENLGFYVCGCFGSAGFCGSLGSCGCCGLAACCQRQHHNEDQEHCDDGFFHLCSSCVFYMSSVSADNTL